MRKGVVIFLFIITGPLFTFSQEIPVTTEQQLENQVDAGQSETEDDSYLQELEHFRRNPLNLNTADADELKMLRVITGLQIAKLISYRNLLGPLLSIYELQAIPAWDVPTIRKLLPYVEAGIPVSFSKEANDRFREGEHSLLIRVSQVLERSAGFDRSVTGKGYLGGPQRVLFRYRYLYKNLLQFGLTGDKDAGEQFGKGVQNKGFDFYSLHLFARKMGIIQSLALGDFSVSMGQGLIHWQGLAFKKSADVMGIKRQSPVLRPYSSAGEFFFHRGAGITIRKGKFESTVFISLRKLGANVVADTVIKSGYVSSFLTSGYHRTALEIADRNNLLQTTTGGSLIYRGRDWHVGLNGVYYRFSLPVQKREEPYNLFAISGNSWYNLGVDYSYTYKNIHFFGEVAADKYFNKAFINGMLVSVDSRVDISFVQRTISPAYQSINGNAFTENTYPTNETGFFAGITLRPAIGWRFDAYGDIFRFPWLKYQVDAPSRGTDFMLQLTYTPNRQVELYSRFRNETKQANQPGNHAATNFTVSIPRQSWRTHFSYKLNTALTLRSRLELVWYDKRGINRENGFLTYFDFIYKPLLKPYTGALRLQYFETDDFNSRLYAYENDVSYSYSIPPFYNKGYRYYLTVNYDIRKKISVWLRWAQTVSHNVTGIGTGLDEIQGNKKTEVKLQARFIL